MRPVLALTGVGSLLLALPGTALAHGDQVPVSELDSAWNLSPAVLAPATLALALYVQGFVRLRRRGRRDHAPWWRAVAFGLGLTLAVLVLVSPIDAIGEEYLLSVHMFQHVVIGDAAAALVLLGLTGPLLFFILPAEVLGPLARARPVRGVARLLSRPAVALAIWAAVFAVWHVPAMFDAALDARWVHDLEHVTFVIAGFVMWYQLLDPARRGHLTRSARLALAVIMFAAGQVLASVLVFSGRVLYEPYALQDERLLGLSPLADQRLAGGVMMAEQAIALGTFAAFLLLAADQEARAGTTVPARPRL
jgi:cytochrome c oxidase assembly factor CtaG